MRNVNPTFAAGNTARNRKPRIAAQIIFDVSSPTLTSHPGIANLPGTPIENVIVDVSTLSQQIYPEEGRATIGSMSLTLIDNGSPNNFTDELREQLNYNAGSRDREIRLYVGFTDDFADFERVGTLFVDNVSYKDGEYTITARDKSKALRQDIFTRKETTIAVAFDADDTTVEVASTVGFQMVPHGASFTDAPNATAGYLLVKDTGEIIRYTGITASPARFTGCTRGVFRTKAQAVTFDTNDLQKDRPGIEEFIYLEMPAPAMAIAILTGVLDLVDSPAPMLPAHWNLGLSLADLDLPSWQNIGPDLWNPADLTQGLQVRFTHLDETDGKQFVEKEIFALSGLFAPIDVTGVIRLKRITRILVASGFDRTLNETNVVEYSELKFDQAAVVNQYRIDYNWNGDELTRSLFFQDNESINIHGPAPVRVFEFRGLSASSHTQRLVAERLGMLRDRYASPPMRLSVTCTPDMNGLELGDLVFVNLAGIQDWADTTTDVGHLNRTFEIQKTSINWTNGDVKLDLVASSRVPADIGQNPTNDPPLDDTFYSSAGTDMDSWAEVTAGVMTGTKNITGTNDVNDSASIWYHDGDLTINGTINITKQAQLRVRGFLTINGTINGVGLGQAGVTDTDTVGGTSTAWARQGVKGAFGPSRGGDGVYRFRDTDNIDFLLNVEGGNTPTTTGANTLPRLSLITGSDGYLSAVLPARLMGTSGGTGGQVVEKTPLNSGTYPPLGSAGIVRAKGGAGGASGSGLAIVCRGLGFGVNGYINLSGLAGGSGGTTYPGIVVDVPTQKDDIYDFPMRAGNGAGGAPGGLYVLLDGDDLLYPDLAGGAFTANQGDTPIGPSGGTTYAAIGTRSLLLGKYPFLVYDSSAGADGRGVDQNPVGHVTGMNANRIPFANFWVAASQVQYLLAPNIVAELVAPPTSIGTETGLGFVRVYWAGGASKPDDQFEIFASTSNNRAFAVEVGQVAANEFIHWLPSGGNRYYWVRRINVEKQVSTFYPVSATGGQLGTAKQSGIAMYTVATPADNWIGDDGSSPIAWTPTGTTITISCYVNQFGGLIATETITVTLNKSTQQMSWAYASGGNHADVTTTASGTPANTITFTFTHTSGEVISRSITSVVGGGVGPQGPPGDPGEPGDPGDPGAPGLNQATAFIYQRTSTSSAPASLPTANVTYTFSSGGMTGLNSGWTATIPAFTGANKWLWVSRAAAVSTSTAVVIAPASWQTAALLSANGTDGAAGEPGEPGAPGAPGTPGSATLAIRLNKVTFATARNNCLFVHGFDAQGAPSGTSNGAVTWNGAAASVPFGTLLASQESISDGWIVVDLAQPTSPYSFPNNGSNLNGGVANYNHALVKRYRGNIYKYDRAEYGNWATFTPTATMVVIGTYSKITAGSAATGQGTITSATTLAGAMSLATIPVEDAAIVKPGDIADDAITSIAPFAAGLDIIGLVTALPAGNDPGPSVVLLTTDTVDGNPYPRLYRRVSNNPAVWTRATDGADITVNTILAGSIQAGAISTRELAAGGVVASRLAVWNGPQGAALNADPMFKELSSLSSAWYDEPTGFAGIHQLAQYSKVSNGSNVGTTALQVASGASNYRAFFSGPLDIDKGKTYRFGYWAIRTNGGNMRHYPAVRFEDINGNNITGSSPASDTWPQGGTYFYFGAEDGSFGPGSSAPATWTKMQIVFGPKATAQIPAGAVRFRVGCLANYPTGSEINATTTLYQDMRVEYQGGATLIEDGAITTDKISVNAITADKIAANQITSREILAGSIAADRLQVGGANLISDPGFEDSDVASNSSWWDRYYTGEGILNGPVAKALAPITAAGADSSLTRMQFTSLASGQWVGCFSNPIPCEPNDVFFLSVKYRTSASFTGATAYPIHVWMYNAQGIEISSTAWLNVVNPSTGWLSHNATLTIPAGIFSIRVGAVCYFTAGWLGVDQYRCVNVSTTALIANGAISGDKLAATLIVGTEITTKPDTSARVILDGTVVPLWIGSGSKDYANGVLYYDAGTNKLVVRGTLSASRIESSVLAPDASNVLPIETSAGNKCPMVINADGGESALRDLDPVPIILFSGTYVVEFMPPDVGGGVNYWRLQEFAQPFDLHFSAFVYSVSTSTSYNASVRLLYRYLTNPTPPAWSSFGDIVVHSVAPNRYAWLNYSGRLKPKPSGWTRLQLAFDIRCSTAGVLKADGASYRIHVSNVGDYGYGGTQIG